MCCKRAAPAPTTPLWLAGVLGFSEEPSVEHGFCLPEGRGGARGTASTLRAKVQPGPEATHRAGRGDWGRVPFCRKSLGLETRAREEVAWAVGCPHPGPCLEAPGEDHATGMHACRHREAPPWVDKKADNLCYSSSGLVQGSTLGPSRLQQEARAWKGQAQGQIWSWHKARLKGRFSRGESGQEKRVLGPGQPEPLEIQTPLAGLISPAPLPLEASRQTNIYEMPTVCQAPHIPVSFKPHNILGKLDKQFALSLSYEAAGTGQNPVSLTPTTGLTPSCHWRLHLTQHRFSMEKQPNRTQSLRTWTPTYL